MVTRVHAALVALVLAAGLARVATYEPPLPPAPVAFDLWGRLVVTRSARMTFTYGPDPSVVETATGSIDVAAQRSSARVDVTGLGPGSYDEVVDRAAVYLRPQGGRWYRYLVTTGAPSRAFGLLALLTKAGPLRHAGRALVRGVPATRYRAADVAEFAVYVDRDGLPRRLEHRAGPPGHPIARLDLHDFLDGGAITVPPRFTAVAGRDEALRAAGLS